MLVIGLLSVSLSSRPVAQVSGRLSLGARYSTALVKDSIVVPIDLQPPIAPTLQLAARGGLSGPWTADATLDLTAAKLKRHESGTTAEAGSFTAIALTLGLRRELHRGINGRLGVGGLVYLADKSGVFQRGNGGVFPLVSLGASYLLPVGARHRLEAGLQYDVHRFITPALRTSGFPRSRPVHRIAVTVSAQLIGR